MANIKERIKRELIIQKELDKDCNDKLLLLFLDSIKYQSQWSSFVTVQFYRYGKLSYECHRFYYPTKELLDFVNNIKGG